MGELETMAMSPLGDFVAVGGTSGLEVLHANGAKRPTPYTGLLTSGGTVQVAHWDTSSHLYVLQGYPNFLHVFTVTADKYVEAPGSPYAIPGDGGGDIAVHSNTATPSN